MAQMVLLIALIVETAFAVYCIVTRSEQKKVSSYLRIAALVAFVLLALVSVIEWGFRWYFLALLLVIWAILGAWTLIRMRKPLPSTEKKYKVSSTILRAIGGVLLVFIVVIPALVFPQYKLPQPTGAHTIATFTATYVDSNRIETYSKTGGNREVNVAFWFPKDAESGEVFPLVVFSHGAFGIKASNTSTFMDLASHGYVVCSIDHPYHSFYTVDSAGKRTLIDPAYLQEFMAVNSGKYDDATDLKFEQSWMNLRAADMNFVLDTILQKTTEPNGEEVYQHIDTAKIGVMGHSLGGESSAQVARERAASGQNDVDAVIDLDADLSGEYLGLQDGKPIINQAAFPSPLLVIFSDTLTQLMAKVQNPDEVIAVKYVLATDPDAFQIHLEGTDHMSLTDLPLVSPLLVALINQSVPKASGVEATPYATVEKMNAIVLQFFNVYLKGQGTFTTASWQ